MAAHKPVVRVNGELVQLPEGDTLLAVLAGAGGNMVEAFPLTITSVGQTSLAVPGGYADHVIVLVRNGAVLDVDSDYTATDEINVVLDYPVVALDEAITAYKFSAFSVANTYTQAQTNALLATKQAAIDENEATIAALQASNLKVVAKLTTEVTNSTLVLSNLLSLTLPKAGVYELFGCLRFNTQVATTGVALSFDFYDMELELTAQVSTTQAANGTASFFEAALTTPGDFSLSTGTPVANVSKPILIRGTLTTVIDNVDLLLQFRSEVNGSVVRMQPNSILMAKAV